MEQNKKMQGKRVLVTGSGTGIGRGVALGFAEAGADVVFHYAHSRQGALTAVEEARKMGVKAEAFKADFGSDDVDKIKNMAGDAIDFLGGIDIIINNAGIGMNMPFEKITAEQFDIIYNVNVRAMFFLTQACVTSMIANRSGVIINISSIHAFESLPGFSVYAGTKGAIVSYTRQLAIELAPKGIRVNAIAAGSIEVQSHYKDIPGYDPADIGRTIPVGFEGNPKDIANVAIFLASDEARYIVAQTLVVDGGTISWIPFSEQFREHRPDAIGKGYVPGI